MSDVDTVITIDENPVVVEIEEAGTIVVQVQVGGPQGRPGTTGAKGDKGDSGESGGSFLPIDPTTKKITNEGVTGDFAPGAVWLDLRAPSTSGDTHYTTGLMVDTRNNVVFSHSTDGDSSTNNTLGAYASSNHIHGSGNSVLGSGNRVQGDSNTVDGEAALVVGSSNHTNTGPSITVFGNSNTGVAQNSLIFGNGNNAGGFEEIVMFSSSAAATGRRRVYFGSKSNGIEFPIVSSVDDVEAPSNGVVVIDYPTATMQFLFAGTWRQVGASSPVVTTQTATYTEAATSGTNVSLCDATAGAIVANLPTAVGNQGFFYIKKVDGSANTISITPNGAETIDGGATADLTRQYESITLVSDGANWSIL